MELVDPIIGGIPSQNDKNSDAEVNGDGNNTEEGNQGLDKWEEEWDEEEWDQDWDEESENNWKREGRYLCFTLHKTMKGTLEVLEELSSLLKVVRGPNPKRIAN